MSAGTCASKHHAVAITVDFADYGPEGQWFHDASNDPALWDFGDLDNAPDAKRIASTADDCRAVLKPFLEHFTALGCVRADGTADAVGFQGSDWGQTPVFYLLTHDTAERGDLSILTDGMASYFDENDLIGIGPNIRAWPVADTGAVFRAVSGLTSRQEVPLWGGPTTPDLFPTADEDCGRWLERVALDEARLHSILERWEISGHNPAMLKLCGSDEERGVSNQVARWVVEGRIPRGVITSLVGNSQAGKSSFAHEIAAALASSMPDGTIRCALGRFSERRLRAT